MKDNRERNRRTAFFAALLIMAVAVLLAGCASKEPITVSKFEAAAKTAGYKTTDITNQYIGDSGSVVKKAVAVDDGKIHVEFLEIDSAAHAAAFYDGHRELIQSSGENTDSAAVDVTGKYGKYSATADAMHYYVAYIGTTVVYAECSPDNAKKMDGFIKGLGY